MARRFTRDRGRLGSQRRETLWTPIAPAIINLTATGTSLAYSASAAEQALRPYTIIRTHLHLSIVSDQVIAQEDQHMAIGFAVVSDQAQAIGITAVPTPITDLDSDAWYLHHFLSNEFCFITGVGFNSGGNQQVEVDSKAMRRVEDGFNNVVTLEVASFSDGMSITTAGRQLLKLH